MALTIIGIAILNLNKINVIGNKEESVVMCDNISKNKFQLFKSFKPLHLGGQG